jgi:hypothetical protein
MKQANGVTRSIRNCTALGILALCLATTTTAADLIKLPAGMGGVSDIGAIPCSVFTQMIVVAPQGTRLSLLTWAAGYYAGTAGKTLSEVAAAAGKPGQTWDYERLTGHLVDYCAANPKAVTSEAVRDLGRTLGAIAN